MASTVVAFAGQQGADSKSAKPFKCIRQATENRHLGVQVGRGILFFVLCLTLSSCSSQSSSCGITTPWIRVVNQASHSVEITAWDGASSVTVQGGTTRVVFPEGARPAPPWHLVVKNPQTGSVLVARVLDQKESVQEVLVKASGTTVKPTTPDTTSGC